MKKTQGTATAASIIKQVGMSVDIDEFGVWNLQESYVGDRYEFWKYIPARLTQHSEFKFLYLERNQISYEKADLVKVTSFYSGISGDNPYSVPVWNIMGESSQEPIETHENFREVSEGFSKSIIDTAGTANVLWRDPATQLFFDKFSVDAGLAEGDAYRLAGVTSYMNCYRLKIIKTYSTSEIPDFSGDGQIWSGSQIFAATPTSEFVPEVTLPNIPGASFNYIKMPSRADQKGKVYRVTEQWMLSDIRGWNPSIYRTYSS